MAHVTNFDRLCSAFGRQFRERQPELNVFQFEDAMTCDVLAFIGSSDPAIRHSIQVWETAEADVDVRTWVAANSWLAPIADKLTALGVAAKSDLNVLNSTELRDLRSDLTTIVAQRKFDIELQKIGMSLDVDAATLAPRRENAAAAI